MPKIKSNGEIATNFIFNQIITRFRILKELVTNHGRHFQNRMMEELASKLGILRSILLLITLKRIDKLKQ